MNFEKKGTTQLVVTVQGIRGEFYCLECVGTNLECNFRKMLAPICSLALVGQRRDPRSDFRSSFRPEKTGAVAIN